MCVRYAFRFIVIAAVLFCTWYSLTRNIPHIRTCANLPSPLYVHPIHSTSDLPAVPHEPRSPITPRIRLLPHSLCETNATVVFVIHSDVRNIVQRQFQRKQLDDAWLETLNARRIFVIGSTAEPTDKYEKEAEKYNDLVQACPAAHAIIDQMEADTVEMVQYIEANPRMSCAKAWHISDLGTYCQGMAYVFSGDQLRHMRENIPRVQFLWMDDWYVTRALLSGSNTTLLDLSDHYCSTNSDEELLVWMTRKQSLRIPQRTIFGHFRPAEEFPLKQSIQLWNEITTMNNRCT
ncbi:N-acetyllactosaminide 3-alpha-galactosyltransferase [Ostertagia ostertagi]